MEPIKNGSESAMRNTRSTLTEN